MSTKIMKGKKFYTSFQCQLVGLYQYRVLFQLKCDDLSMPIQFFGHTQILSSIKAGKDNSHFFLERVFLLKDNESLRSHFLGCLDSGQVLCFSWCLALLRILGFFTQYFRALVWFPFRFCYLFLVGVMLQHLVLPHLPNGFSLGSSMTVRCPGSVLSSGSSMLLLQIWSHFTAI